MRKAISFVLALALAPTGCSEQKTTTQSDSGAVESGLAARMGDWTLTKEFLIGFIEQLPDGQRRRFNTPLGRAELADIFIGDELFHQEAIVNDLENDPDVVKQLAEAKRSILIAAYSKKHIEPDALPSEDEIHDYYELHADEYMEVAFARAQHVFTKTRERAEELMRLVVDQGERLTTVAHKYSEDDLTKRDGGDLGYFNPTGYIRGVGFSPILSDTLWKIEVGKIVGPIEWEKGYSIVRVNERHQDSLLPYADVRDQISKQLMRDRLDTTRLSRVTALMKEYEFTNYMAQIAREIERSPQELFDYAQTLENPYQRVKAYEELLEKYPDDDYAPQALFMIGFVYAEEIGDPVEAQRVLSRVVLDYRDSEVAESAKWMLENLGKPMPKFEDIDDLNDQIKESN